MGNKKTFEDNLKELEEIATKLETGNIYVKKRTSC